MFGNVREMDGHSYRDFESAGHAVLEFLHRRMGFDLWMLTRTEGDSWIVLQSEDHGYGVEPGTVFSWADTFCFEMVKGSGPRIAPRSEDIPAYAAARIGRQVAIKAYVGMPLVQRDGSLFGTLCAIHPSSQPQSIVEEEDLVELLGALLSTLLQNELRAADDDRAAERLQAEALADPLTKLYNRRGWDRLLAAEEERCRRYGHSAAVVIVDLDELKLVNDSMGHAAGDLVLIRAAEALRGAARSIDVVARLGGDEFGILSVECDRAGAELMVARIRTALASGNVEASLGLAMREPGAKSLRGLTQACEVADRLMYEEKNSR